MQLPLVHAAVKPEGAAGQAYRHPPQLLVVLSAVSHPLLARLSQLPKPAVHSSAHPSGVHIAVLLGPDKHATPQRLQLLVVLTIVSQPLPEFASQLPKPRRHENPHVPPEHTALAFDGANKHMRPQPPQLRPSVCRLTSHPFAGLPSQSA